ncbi:MAG: hypothetical protein OXH97_02820 [Chloroflexota bacterium]|nr:hypothetical protein [Chloroflexota bacterium]
MVSESPIPRTERPAIADFLAQRLVGPVALDVWTQQDSELVRTDRDPCTFCEQVTTAARQFASLHPAISLTRYDLDRHVDRAREARIERAPVTVIRGRGHELRIVGLWSGVLFPAFMEAVVYASSGAPPLQASTLEKLAQIDESLDEDLDVELLIAPYDPQSATTLRLAAAIAMVMRRVRVEAIELSEFPLLAEARMVAELPVVTIGGGRRFTGGWAEEDFAEQLRRSAAGETESVIRDRILTSPFLTIDQAQAIVTGETPPPDQQQPPVSPGGLVLPR